MAIYIVFIILTPIVIHANTLYNPYSYNNESNLIPMSIYEKYAGTQNSVTVKSRKDLGFRLDADLGFPLFFGNNKSMKKLWGGVVPLPEDDTLEWLNLMLDINFSIRVYHKLVLGAFYSQYGPEMIKSVTYTTSGYWYWWNNCLYYQYPGSYTNKYFLSFNNSEHKGILFRYYVSPFDKTNKTTWDDYESEAYLELGIGQTNLHGGFSTNYELSTSFSGSSIPYLHLAFAAHFRLRYLPGYWGLNIKVNTSNVSKIKDSDGNIVYNPDGSKLSVDFTSVSFGGGLGICF